MPLWGKTDAAISQPKYLTDADKANSVFVSAEEALLNTNKSKGITGAGWWLVKEYTASNGETRYKTENIIAMSIANATAGDAADDAKVADVEVAIAITAQPGATVAFVDGQPLTLTVVATVTSGSLSYQWQRKPAAEGARWSNISGATAADYTTAALTAANVGDSYRVVLGSTSGAVKVTGDATVLEMAP